MNQNDYHVNITLIILTVSHEAEPQSFTAGINLIEAPLAKAVLLYINHIIHSTSVTMIYVSHSL